MTYHQEICVTSLLPFLCYVMSSLSTSEQIGQCTLSTGVLTENRHYFSFKLGLITNDFVMLIGYLPTSQKHKDDINFNEVEDNVLIFLQNAMTNGNMATICSRFLFPRKNEMNYMQNVFTLMKVWNSHRQTVVCSAF